MSRSIAPYGSWPSPITAKLLTESGISFSEVRVDGEDVYWIERRPHESGRSVVVRKGTTGPPSSVLPEGFSVSSRVHEYGGGAYAVESGRVLFVNDEDQRLYSLRPGAEPVAVTPEPTTPQGLRYADIEVVPGGTHGVCVRESHENGGEPDNTLVVLPIDGGGSPRRLHAGRDFYACPRVSADGRRLAWISWDHPHMPWDRSEAWVGELTGDGGIAGARRVAGGGDESVFQVAWSPRGVLHVVSDRSGFWNLYSVTGDRLESVAPIDAELGNPQWNFAMATVAFLTGDRIACAYHADGSWHLGVIPPGGGRIEPIPTTYTDISRAPRIVADDHDRLVFVGGSPTRAREVVRLTFGESGAAGTAEVLRRAVGVTIDDAHLSRPEPIEFATTGDRTAHALFYAPASAAYRGPEGELPPLIVLVHGGPTASTSSALSLDIQFWTNRGIAVADVNYSGSSGYGRAYRDRLRGQWGVADVNDCVAVATWLAREGRVDPERMAMSGGSAGGYTTLCALVFHDVFAAGASSYGIGDLEALAADTHKFESRYNDYLIGPYPEMRSVYRERSPIHFADRLTCPVILLQGLEDKVVPPSQARRFVEVLEAKGLPYAYVEFPDEGHGFRKAENVARAVEAELAFFGHVFGFTPADTLPPLDVRNARA